MCDLIHTMDIRHHLRQGLEYRIIKPYVLQKSLTTTIITKSISRFARNTLDCLQYIRQLKGKNIPVYVEKESINTMDAKGDGFIPKRIQNDTSAYGLRRLEIRGFEGLVGFPVVIGSRIFV